MTEAAKVQQEQKATLIRGLSLLDSVLLLVGGIIGSAIFLAVSDVAEHLTSPILFLGVWVAGGAISLLACFAFAELGAMFPNSGGQYVYLREAYGDFFGFLFGWMVLFINFSGTTAALSVGFATYLDEVVPYGAKAAIFQLGSWA
ncbi:MAG TPA: amino acid permease, partial [Terriglobales bacterium]|nr:amino acid permease [Terriglobales bacterium]